MYQEVSLPRISNHEEVALVYGFNLELEESEGEVSNSLPGSYVREVFFSGKS